MSFGGHKYPVHHRGPIHEVQYLISIPGKENRENWVKLISTIVIQTHFSESKHMIWKGRLKSPSGSPVQWIKQIHIKAQHYEISQYWHQSLLASRKGENNNNNKNKNLSYIKDKESNGFGLLNSNNGSKKLVEQFSFQQWQARTLNNPPAENSEKH